MNERSTLLKLKAFAEGKPLPNSKLLCTRRTEPRETRVLAFVKMGGETLPWGVAFGPPTKKPHILTVRDPRERDDVAEMMAELGESLIEYLTEEEEPQIWVPNPSHLEMLHFLALAYHRSRKANDDRLLRLHLLARAAYFLFQEAQFPTQPRCVDATAALREAYVFPAERLRQAHLGFLLGWLTGGPGLEARRRAAALAEKESVATSLSPELENQTLAPLLEGEGTKSSTQALDKALRTELSRRFSLTSQAITFLAKDARKENPGLSTLTERATERLERFRERMNRLESGEPDFAPNPETDWNPASAASAYLRQEGAETEAHDALIHHDTERQNAELAEGRALRGKVTRVSDEKRPVWHVTDTQGNSLRIREGDTLAVAGFPAIQVRVRSISPDPRGRRQFILHVVKGHGTSRDPKRPSAGDSSWRNKALTFVETSMSGFKLHAASQIRKTKNGPGSWLSHKGPGWSAGNEDLV